MLAFSSTHHCAQVQPYRAASMAVDCSLVYPWCFSLCSCLVNCCCVTLNPFLVSVWIIWLWEFIMNLSLSVFAQCSQQQCRCERSEVILPMGLLVLVVFVLTKVPMRPCCCCCVLEQSACVFGVWPSSIIHISSSVPLSKASETANHITDTSVWWGSAAAE